MEIRAVAQGGLGGGAMVAAMLLCAKQAEPKDGARAALLGQLSATTLLPRS